MKTKLSDFKVNYLASPVELILVAFGKEDCMFINTYRYIFIDGDGTVSISEEKPYFAEHEKKWCTRYEHIYTIGEIYHPEMDALAKDFCWELPRYGYVDLENLIAYEVGA